ncbi:MAG: NAD(P)-dependent oxidoreductase [Actinomycetota bacterium]|nr:NAD(P)-dependent oxidoreductase [Actinomycetota bacterium]
MTRASDFAGWRPKILVTAPLRGEGFERLREMADVVYDPWIEQHPLRIYNSKQLTRRIVTEGVDALVVESDMVGAEVYDTGVRFVAATRADPVNVDLPGAARAGIPVVRCPGRNADAVAELAVALLFAVARRLLPADDDVRAGQVYRDGTIPYQRFRAWELSGRTAGLVGLGAVGRATRWRLAGLGLRVVAFDPYSEEETVSLGQLLEVSDVVSMHAPVTPETTGMIGAAEFDAMKEGAFYLNTARAKLHDTNALVEALRSGRLAGAGLDHFEGEHLATDHPLVGMGNVVLTPHIGGATWDTECRQATIVADELSRLIAGDAPLHLVNPEALA